MMSDRDGAWIVSDPAVLGGRPHIRGSTVTVARVLELIGGGKTVDDMLREEPALSRAAIDAAVRFSGRLSH
ncbi:MAG: DUF433 domain-containing protein [Dehalococcoidia bacterium]|jgi:uncharacterized protein (DUF433 family)|nr:DUF433 domain-containing protein [Dehalococcoidia bacterium]